LSTLCAFQSAGFIRFAEPVTGDSSPDSRASQSNGEPWPPKSTRNFPPVHPQLKKIDNEHNMESLKRILEGDYHGEYEGEGGEYEEVSEV